MEEEKRQENYGIQSFLNCFYAGKIKQEQSKTGMYVRCALDTHQMNEEEEEKNCTHNAHFYCFITWRYNRKIISFPFNNVYGLI